MNRTHGGGRIYVDFLAYGFLLLLGHNELHLHPLTLRRGEGAELGQAQAARGARQLERHKRGRVVAAVRHKRICTRTSDRLSDAALRPAGLRRIAPSMGDVSCLHECTSTWSTWDQSGSWIEIQGSACVSVQHVVEASLSMQFVAGHSGSSVLSHTPSRSCCQAASHHISPLGAEIDAVPGSAKKYCFAPRTANKTANSSHEARPSSSHHPSISSQNLTNAARIGDASEAPVASASPVCTSTPASNGI
eukprot:398666-Prymnesium_polylepis.2